MSGPSRASTAQPTCAQATIRASQHADELAPAIVEAIARAIFSRVWSAAPDAFHPAFEHGRDLWDEVARDALSVAGHGALLAALVDMRARFHRAVILGGTDFGFADAACERADAAIAAARGVTPHEARHEQIIHAPEPRPPP